MHKLTAISFFIFLIYTTGFNSSSKKSDIQKKIIRQGNFDIEFFVSLKDPGSFALNKTYFWYKSGEIHQSISGAGGFVLHSEFEKHYRSNQLVEKGTFNYGLKNGLWKKWHENGKIELIEEWKKGERNGIYITFDSVGKRLTKGYYKNNYKSGDWINYINKDTTSYSKGNIKTVAPKEKESFFKRLFKKKESNKKESNKKGKKTSNKKQSNQSKNTTKNKESFFKRLFGKKKNKGKKKS